MPWQRKWWVGSTNRQGVSNGEPARGVRGVLRMLGAVWEKSDEALYGRKKMTKGEAFFNTDRQRGWVTGLMGGRHNLRGFYWRGFYCIFHGLTKGESTHATQILAQVRAKIFKLNHKIRKPAAGSVLIVTIDMQTNNLDIKNIIQSNLSITSPSITSHPL